MKRLVSILFCLSLAGYATAAGVGGPGVSGLRTHDHSGAAQGGSTLSGVTLSGTTTIGAGRLNAALANVIFLSSPLDVDVSGNLYFDGAAWQRYDTAQPSMLLDVGQGTADFSTAVAAANPASFTRKVRIDSTGIRIDMPTGSVQTASSARAIGYSPSFEVLNKDSTQNWYFGVDDDHSKRLNIARGYGPNQTGGGAPAIAISVADVVTVANTLSSVKACATGFTRLSPNYCSATASTNDGWTDTASCTAKTLGQSLPADAKAVVLEVTWSSLSNNATGLRNNSLFFWNDSSCTQKVGQFTFGTREQAATAAGTVLGQGAFTAIVPMVTTNTYYFTETNAGGNGNAGVVAVTAIGYLD